ncbi:hypothetical protein Lal_00034131 [Lupinus albus]|nr:hypothetical protein Lal_00034131 [Lupinus albus]
MAMKLQIFTGLPPAPFRSYSSSSSALCIHKKKPLNASFLGTGGSPTIALTLCVRHCTVLVVQTNFSTRTCTTTKTLPKQILKGSLIKFKNL